MKWVEMKVEKEVEEEEQYNEDTRVFSHLNFIFLKFQS